MSDTTPFRGWWVLGAAFAVLFLSYGLQFSYGVFAAGMAADLGWSRAATSLPYSIYVFIYSALSAATGRATDRFGPRPIITAGAVLLGIGWGASAFVHAPWQLVSTMAVAALGMSVAWVPCNATVSRWFTRRRGTAVAIASAGGSLGNLLVPALAAAMLSAWGWRVALGVTALVSTSLMMVAGRHMIRDPETIGQWPDGDPTPPPQGTLAAGQTLAEVRGTEPFLLIIVIYFMTWVPIFVPFVHGPAYAEDLGAGKLAAAGVLSAIGIGGLVGRLCSGVVSDRIGRMPSLLAVFALQAVAFVMYTLAHAVDTVWAASALFGFAYGGGVTLLPPLCSDLFGRAHVAAIVGMIFAVAGSPAAIGPFVAGWLYDVSGSYAVAFISSAVLNVIAFVLTAWLAWRLRRAR